MLLFLSGKFESLQGIVICKFGIFLAFTVNESSVEFRIKYMFVKRSKTFDSFFTGMFRKKHPTLPDQFVHLFT